MCVALCCVVLDLCWQHKRGNVAGAVEFGHLCCAVLDLRWQDKRGNVAGAVEICHVWPFVLASEFGLYNTKRANTPVDGGAEALLVV